MTGRTVPTIRNRRILLTGATDGIGLAMAAMLAPLNEMVVTGRKAPAEIEGRLPSNVTYCQADQGDLHTALAAVENTLSDLNWHFLDIAILNAATGYAGEAVSETAASIRTICDTNLLFPMLLSRNLAGRLAGAKGRLLLIGSVAYRGAPGFASYAAGKAGLDAFARSLGEEWRDRIKVGVVHPGPTRTAMHEKAGHSPGAAEKFFIPADDMASMIIRRLDGRAGRVTLGHRAWLLSRLGGSIS